MLLIQRRYDGTEWEHIATYEDGEFHGDEKFVRSFGWLEGHDEELIMEELDGPDLLAVQPDEPDVIDLSKYRVYIDDPEEAPDDVEVQEGNQGGLYYERNPDRDDSDDDTQPDEDVDHDYDVDTEFGRSVAAAVERGDLTDKVAANQWRDFSSEITDEDLLIDALKQITDGGSKTAKDRAKSRLRAMDWTDEEIDKAISSEPEPIFPGVSIGTEVKFEQDGNVMSGEVVGEDSTGLPLIEVPADEVPEAFADVDTVQVFAEEQHIFEADGEPWPPLDDREPDEIVEGMDLDGSLTSSRNELDHLWEVASTDELRELRDQHTFNVDEIDDPVDFAQDIEDTLNNKPQFEWTSEEEQFMHVGANWALGEISDEEYGEEVLEFVEENPGIVDGINNQKRKALDAMLWYREGTDTRIEDFVDLEFDEDRVIDEDYQAKLGLSTAMEKMNPAMGSATVATLEGVKIENISGSAAGRHSHGKIEIDINGSTIQRTTAHEFGHQVHSEMGIPSNDYPSSDEFNHYAERDRYGFGTEREDISDSDAVELYNEVRENWDRYVDGDVDEIRPYQKRHGVEYLAVSFAHWSTDEMKLKDRDPFMAQFWSKEAGDADEIEDVQNVEVGDEIIIDGGQTYNPFEVKELNDGVYTLETTRGTRTKMTEDELADYFEQGVRE